jgi:hypothetical protein
MEITVDEVLEKIEAQVADLGSALSGLREMLDKNSCYHASSVFGAMSKNADLILDTIEFWRNELKADNEAQPASIEPHHPESTSNTEVIDEGTT